MFHPEQRKLIESLISVAETESTEIYLVGGIVRDLLLGHDPEDRDLDFIVLGDARIFAEKAAAVLGGEVKAFDRFLTAKLLSPTGFSKIDEVDFASTRSESYEHPGALPVVARAESLESDLLRRDFTINALAIPLKEVLEIFKDGADIKQSDSLIVDSFSGVSDLRQGLVRVLHDQSFIDDPTRLFRAARYAARIEGQIEKNTEHLFTVALDSDSLNSVSGYRKFAEINKIFAEGNSAQIINDLDQRDFFKHYSIFSNNSISDMIDSLRRLDSLSTSLSSLEKQGASWLVSLDLSGEEFEAELKDFQISKKQRAELNKELEDLKKASSLKDLPRASAAAAQALRNAEFKSEDWLSAFPGN